MNDPVNENPAPQAYVQQPIVENNPLPPSKEVNQRPGTSRKGGRTLATKDDEDWTNQEVYLP